MYSYFNYFFLAISLANNVSFAFYEYKPSPSEDNQTNFIINYMEIAFTLLYLIEAVLKIVVHGLYQHRRSYFRNPWNYIDSIIIITG